MELDLNRRGELVQFPHGVRSEALECVQLAAAFLPASLLAGITKSLQFRFLSALSRVQAPTGLRLPLAVPPTLSLIAIGGRVREGEWILRTSDQG
jgi:hypothetical protein